MELDLSRLLPRQRYQIIASVIVPRPIAWVTTVDGAGVVNAAPFSFFNAMGSDPAIVALGIGLRPDGEPKDTLRNIASNGEFVVNLVPYALREAMNRSAASFDPGVSEVEAVGLTTAPSVRVRPPRLAASPVHLECRQATLVEIGRNHVVLGEVLHVHVDDACTDPATGRVLSERLDLIGRMDGPDGYLRTCDRFSMGRVRPDGTAQSG